MIRTAYPIPRFSPFRQAQLRLDVASRRTRRALQARRQKLAAASARPLPPVLPPAAAITAPAYGQWEKEKTALDAFYDRYDGLTALICLAAQEGVTTIRESRYQTAREWLMEAYPAGIQQGVAPYLASKGTGNESDPFACFWTPPTLVDLLHNDDGNLIERMERTQNALAVWEKALRVRLAAQYNS